MITPAKLALRNKGNRRTFSDVQHLRNLPTRVCQPPTRSALRLQLSLRRAFADQLPEAAFGHSAASPCLLTLYTLFYYVPLGTVTIQIKLVEGSPPLCVYPGVRRHNVTDVKGVKKLLKHTHIYAANM